MIHRSILGAFIWAQAYELLSFMISQGKYYDSADNC